MEDSEYDRQDIKDKLAILLEHLDKINFLVLTSYDLSYFSSFPMLTQVPRNKMNRDLNRIFKGG